MAMSKLLTSNDFAKIDNPLIQMELLDAMAQSYHIGLIEDLTHFR